MSLRDNSKVVVLTSVGNIERVDFISDPQTQISDLRESAETKSSSIQTLKEDVGNLKKKIDNLNLINGTAESISSGVSLLEDIKNNIKSEIIKKGGELPEDAIFSDYYRYLPEPNGITINGIEAEYTIAEGSENILVGDFVEINSEGLVQKIKNHPKNLGVAKQAGISGETIMIALKTGIAQDGSTLIVEDTIVTQNGTEIVFK